MPVALIVIAPLFKPLQVIFMVSMEFITGAFRLFTLAAKTNVHPFESVMEILYPFADRPVKIFEA